MEHPMPTPLGGGTTSTVLLTGDNAIIDAMLPDNDNARRRWGEGSQSSTEITFSFASPSSVWSHDPSVGYGPTTLESEPWAADVRGATQAQAAHFRAALQRWADVANITFIEVDDGPNNVGDLRMGYSSLVGDYGAAAWAYYPFASGAPAAGDIWFDPEPEYNAEVVVGEFGFLAMIHEIGHALGLAHPFQGSQADQTFLTGHHASRMYSVMGYQTHPTNPGEPITPLLYDILAIQYIYGANTTFHAGDDVYRFGADQVPIQAIWDAGGADTIDLSSQTRDQKLDLRSGAFSSIGGGNDNVAIAYSVTIENAIGGTGSDTLTGNDAANIIAGGAGADVLFGGNGDDVLEGGVGRDRMVGGAGNDTYLVDDLDDPVFEEADGGQDELRTGFSTELPAGVEVLTLTAEAGKIGIGNKLGNLIIGTEFCDQLVGGAGADTLQGGAGSDVLVGGAGNDVYILNDVDDIICDWSGVDEARTTVNLSLAPAIENAALLGEDDLRIVGNGLSNRIAGNSGDNSLHGGAGDDGLGGGQGSDVLAGDGGSDYLAGGAGQDTLTGGEGRDKFAISREDLLDGTYDVVTDFLLGEDKIAVGDLMEALGVRSLSTLKNSGYLSVLSNGAGTSIVYDDPNDEGGPSIVLFLKGCVLSEAQLPAALAGSF
jgi:serralysin